MRHVNRREFLRASSIAAISLSGPAPRAYAGGSRGPKILLKNLWQTVNIGDIAHAPGILALLERHIPEADVVLWAGADTNAEVRKFLHDRFPRYPVVTGGIDETTGRASNDALRKAIDESDFLLHGSGAGFVAGRDVARYVKHTGKPFGVYGITYSTLNEERSALLSSARFVFFRDTVSLARARAAGVECPIMQFGPDSAFAADLRDDEAASRFLAAHDLAPQKFVCCIPRLRYTPYWLIRDREKDEKKAARNEQMKEHDHAILREAIAAVVEATDLKVLLCAEDMTQMAVGREMIYDKLPQSVRRRVVWRKDYWLTPEAISTYVQSAGLFGLEMHSPIMCVGNGVPALVGRFEEQTTKGYMWRDIGLGDWLFDFDNPNEVAQLVPTLLRIIVTPDWAKERVRLAQTIVEQRQRETTQIVREAVVA